MCAKHHAECFMEKSHLVFAGAFAVYTVIIPDLQVRKEELREAKEFFQSRPFGWWESPDWNPGKPHPPSESTLCASAGVKDSELTSQGVGERWGEARIYGSPPA